MWFHFIFQWDKNNCLCTYKHKNYADDYLQGINLYNYQVCSHDEYALKVLKRNIGPLNRVCA